MSYERFAPEGWLWVCHACGKTHTDQYGSQGEGSHGWDESCALNSALYPRSRLVFSGKRVVEVLPADSAAEQGEAK